MLLSDAIDIYKTDRLAKGIAKTTVRAEQSSLKQFLAAAGNIQTHSISVKTMDRFWNAHPEWAPSTWNLKKAHMSSFFTWLRLRGYMPKAFDPLEGLRKRRVPKVQRTLVPVSKFEELIEAAPNPRDRAMVAISLYLFTRISETAAIRWRDVDFDRKTVAIYRTKTEQYDVLPMCEELEHELRRWKFEYGREAGEVPRPDWYVVPAYSTPKFSGGRGGQLYMVQPPRLMPATQLKNITGQIKRVLGKLGYDADKEGGHTLRRSGATALYHELARNGHDRSIRTVQAMLGHANISTTEIYLSLDLDRKARNDLLAGKRMFAAQSTGDLIDLEALDGEADVGTL